MDNLDLKAMREAATKAGDDDVLALLDRVERAEAGHNELLYAVARKFQGETRHETALRYIRDAELLAIERTARAAQEVK